MNQFETIDYQVLDQVGVITLNRPQSYNALNTQLRAELYDAVLTANRDNNIRIVVIAGAGKNFCSGADLKEDKPGADCDGFVTEHLREEYHPFLLAITESDKPYIGAINGTAAGIGAAIALSCDLVVMAEDASLYSPFAVISLIPDGGSHWMLSRYLGNKKAFEMIAESQRLSAQQCEQLGMANRVVARDDLQRETLTWAESLAAVAPLTLRYSKQLLREVPTMNLAQSMDREAQLQNILFRSEDYSEGVQAFLTRRAPKFTGR